MLYHAYVVACMYAPRGRPDIYYTILIYIYIYIFLNLYTIMLNHTCYTYVLHPLGCIICIYIYMYIYIYTYICILYYISESFQNIAGFCTSAAEYLEEREHRGLPEDPRHAC